MTEAWFVSDLHGKQEKYAALFRQIQALKPSFVFFGGDLTPHRQDYQSFFDDVFTAGIKRLRKEMGCMFPDIFVIAGNDDAIDCEEQLRLGEEKELWIYLHNRIYGFGPYKLMGYATVSPTPFRYKAWEKQETEIAEDLAQLSGNMDMNRAVCLFHSPPADSLLDQAHAGHVGSRAIAEFIQTRQPWVTLHGHIHESTGLSGEWKQKFGRTMAFQASNDDPEVLSIIKFRMDEPEVNERLLIPV